MTFKAMNKYCIDVMQSNYYEMYLKSLVIVNLLITYQLVLFG